MRRPLVALAAVALVGAALVGCSSDDDGKGWTLPAIGPADVEVDTPALREAKADAGIDDCPPAAGGAVDGGLPEMTLPCFGGGRSVDLATLRGPMVISVWAQWCTPCRNEMPVLQEFHDDHGDEVPLLGIDFQDPQTDDAMDFLEETGARYPQLADPGGSILGIDPFPRGPKLPFLLLVDADGTVSHRQFVEITSTEQLEGLVAEHLGVDL